MSDKYTHIIKWATECLISKGYSIQHPTEIVLETPWSTVLRFLTPKGDVYLKQPAPTLFLEANITQLLADRFNASVPIVIATNNDLHCFLMKDAGQNLRQYLKTEFQPLLLCQAIKEYTTIQRSTENNIEEFLDLGVPDWRLNKLPKLFDQIIQETEFLKENDITDNELTLLRNLSPKFLEQCESLSQYQIPDTLVQPDFNTNNILFNPNTKKITCIDLGEIAIAHPFFSLHNFLLQATIHEGIKR